MNAILRRPGEILDLVQECRRLSAELYSAGGVTIDTAIDGPPGRPGEGVPIAARTLIQPDGDVVCFATDRYCLDADLRMAHGRNVATWYGRAESTLSDAVAVMRSLSRAVGVFFSLVLSGFSVLKTGGALRFVVPVIVFSLVFAAIGAVARLVIPRLISSVLGHR